jgi:hypothetical protein
MLTPTDVAVVEATGAMAASVPPLPVTAAVPAAPSLAPAPVFKMPFELRKFLFFIGSNVAILTLTYGFTVSWQATPQPEQVVGVPLFIGLFLVPVFNFIGVVAFSQDDIQDKSITNGSVYRRALTVAFASLYFFYISMLVLLQLSDPAALLPHAPLKGLTEDQQRLAEGILAQVGSTASGGNVLMTIFNELNSTIGLIISFYFGGGLAKDVLQRYIDSRKPAPAPTLSPVA